MRGVRVGDGLGGEEADSLLPADLDTQGPAAARGIPRSSTPDGATSASPRRGTASRPAAADEPPAALAGPAAAETIARQLPVPAAGVDAVIAPSPEVVDSYHSVLGAKPTRSGVLGLAGAASPSSAANPLAALTLPKRAVLAPPTPPALTLVRAHVTHGVSTLLNVMTNWAAGLPAGNVTTFLAGALDILRRNLFNQAPHVTPIQWVATEVTPDGRKVLPGTFKGNLGIIDAERDSVKATVVTAPQAGTVDLNSETGRYTYTAGPTFTGRDSFTVRVAPTTPRFNLLAPFGDGSKVVTIQVGSGALTIPWQSSALTSGLTAATTHQDPTDVALYLPDAPVQVAIRDGRNGYRVTVTTKTITDNTNITWMTPTGSSGTIRTRTFLDQHWDEFKLKSNQNGVTGATVVIEYFDRTNLQGSNDKGDRAIILTNVGTPVRTADGQYQITGDLALNPPTSPDRITEWDVRGTSFKQPYERFLQANSLNPAVGPGFPVSLNLNLSKSAVFIDNYTPLSYRQNGLVKEASAPTVGVPPTSDGTAVGVYQDVITTVTSLTGVTAAIPFGGSGAFLTGSYSGEVALWVDGVKTQLQGGGWKSPVTAMLELSEPLTDAQGKPVTTSFTGRIDSSILTVTEVAPNARIVVGKTIAGPDVADGTKITGFLSGTPGREGTYSVSGDPQTVAEASLTQPDVPVMEESFVVGLEDGALELWTASKGWQELKPQGNPSRKIRDVAAIVATGAADEDGDPDSFVVGLGDGSVLRYSPDGKGTFSKETLWGEDGNAVKALVAYGDPALGKIIVGRADGSVQLFQGSGGGGWITLETLRGREVRSMTNFRDGVVVVGFADSKVAHWDGKGDFLTTWWTDTQGGWLAPINTIVPWKDGFVVGLGGLGGVEYFECPFPCGGKPQEKGWIELQGNQWGSAVVSMMVYSDTELDKDGNLVETPAGIIVGLENGAVKYWNGTLNPNRWRELHDAGWANSVNVLLPLDQYVSDELGNPVLRETVIAGLGGGVRGTVQQWRGDFDQNGRAVWEELSPRAAKLTAELARAALDYGWANGGKSGDEGDPLFAQLGYKPGCNYTDDCDGNYYPIQVAIGTPDKPKPLAGWKFSVPGTDGSVDLNYDLNAFAYGYAWVPNGVLNKLRPGKYSVAALIALPTGPSIAVNTNGGSISTEDVNLISAPPLYQVFPFGTVAVDVGVNGKVEGTLTGAKGDTLRAHAYYVPTVLWTYNTAGNPGDIQMGFTAYPDVNYDDFKDITDVTITPTLTPYASVKYGLFTPASTPLIGEFSVFEAGLGYENPVSLSLKIPTDLSGPSLTLSSEGDLKAFAGIIPSITDLLTWEAAWEIYKVQNDIFGPSSASAGSSVVL